MLSRCVARPSRETGRALPTTFARPAGRMFLMSDLLIRFRFAKLWVRSFSRLTAWCSCEAIVQ